MQKNNFNFVFWGTPEVSVKTLEILKNSGFLPSLIITNPDSKKGRGMHQTPSPVAIWAENNGISCLKPEKIDENDTTDAGVKHLLKQVFNTCPDLFIVVAYGKILPKEIIEMPKFGTINIHYSLLPKYRGASPVEQALLNGDKETGVSIQQMNFKLDSGPILFEQKVDIGINETKFELLEKLIKIGGTLLAENLPNIFEGKVSTRKQDEKEATFCKKIKKEDGLLDLSDNPIKNYNKYRAFFGWPGTYFFKDNKRYKITKAKYENDSFIIGRVIPEGKKETDFNTLK